MRLLVEKQMMLISNFIDLVLRFQIVTVADLLMNNKLMIAEW